MKKLAFESTFGSYLVGAYLFSVPAFSYSADLGLSIVPQVIGFSVMLYALYDILITKRLFITLEVKLYCLFACYVALTFPMFGNLEYSDSVFTLLKIVLITLASSQLVKTEADFYTILKLFSLSIFVVLYFNYHQLQYLRFAYILTGMDRFAGTLANANTAAIYAIAIIWASLMLLIKEKYKLVGNITWASAIILALTILFYCGSKKGMIGVILFSLFLLVSFWIRYKNNFLKRTLSAAAGFALCYLSIWFVYRNPFYSRLEKAFLGEDTGSSLQRLIFIEEAFTVWLSNIKTFLFGVGHNTFRDYSVFASYSHSTITEILSTNGIIGFVLYFSFYFLLGYSLYRFFRHSQLLTEKREAYLILMFWVTFLFFTTTAILHYTREFHPLLGVIATYINIKRKHLRQFHLAHFHPVYNRSLNHSLRKTFA